MKKIITVTLCIVLVLLFAGCGKNGDTSKVEIDYGASSIYSKEEIDSAIEIIKKQFALFEGCELHRLSYMTDEECNNADNIEWMNDLRTDDNKEAFTQCIAFESSFCWHKHIVPLWNGAKDVLFSKELKIDQIKCETEYKVVENQSIFSETMTKEEVDAEKRKLLYHWIGLLSSLTKLRNAGELDVESTLAQLTEPMMIERVNALLGENPNLLETDKYILLHSLLGRDLYMEGQLIPIRAAEIKKVAKNNGGF